MSQKPSHVTVSLSVARTMMLREWVMKRPSSGPLLMFLKKLKWPVQCTKLDENTKKNNGWNLL
jgi:hypothetical protein